MTVTNIRNREQILETASEWVVRMDNSALTQHEVEQLQQWLAESASHRKAFAEMVEIWGVTDELKVLSELLPSGKAEPLAVCRLAQWWRQCTKSISTRLARKLTAYAAMACTLLLVFLSWQLELFGKTYVTPVGTQRTMTLADGSLMRMNTNTRIKVVYSGSTRLIVLQQGEAQFDVKKDNQRPLTVRVGEASVTAVGTAFNIDYSRDIADVLVTEGVVEINAAPPATNGFFTTLADRTPAPAASRISLSEGQSAKIDKSVQAVRQLQPEEIHRKLAWQKGMLMFNGERLAEVIEQVTRYTDTRIIIDDADIANIAIGGYFRTGDTHAMLDALQNSFDIKVTRVNQKLVLLGKNSQL